MSTEQRETLYARYPVILTGTTADGRSWRVGLEHNDGWLGILDGVFDALCAHAAAVCRAPPKAAQIKEKLGSLRVYLSEADGFDAVATRLTTNFSDRVCETCGAPGRPHNANGWLLTACPVHAAEHKAVPQDLSGWTLPRLPPLDHVDYGSVRAAHAAVLAANAAIDIPPGWLDLVDCTLGLLAQRNAADAHDHARVVRDTPAGVTVEIGGALAIGGSAREPYQVRRIVAENDRLLLDIVPLDVEAVGIADCAAALSRRVDHATGAMRMLGSEEYAADVPSRAPDQGSGEG